MSSDVSIDLMDQSTKPGALVIVCFPGPGFVANIVGQHLIDSLELELIGSVRHADLPPACIVKKRAFDANHKDLFWRTCLQS